MSKISVEEDEIKSYIKELVDIYVDSIKPSIGENIKIVDTLNLTDDHIIFIGIDCGMLPKRKAEEYLFKWKDYIDGLGLKGKVCLYGKGNNYNSVDIKIVDGVNRTLTPGCFVNCDFGEE